MILSGNVYPWKIFTAEIMNQIRLEKVCEMILFIGGPVDWEGGPVDWGMGGRRHGRHGWGHWIPWERLRDSPELRVWKKRKRIRSDDRQTDKQMDIISTCILDPCEEWSKNSTSPNICPKIEINTYVLHLWQNHIPGQLLHGQYFVQTSDGSHTF